jgi:hypothetical protein
VVNLVTEDSIEHGILHLLTRKQALADGVLDGRGDLAALKMPSGRAALIERMQAMLAAAEAPKLRALSPEEALVEEMKRRHGERLLLVESRGSGLLAVVEADAPSLAAERERLAARAGAAALPVEVIDGAAWQAMQRLAAAGLVQLAEGARVLHRARDIASAEPARPAPAARAAELLRQADRSARMASVLVAGGFADEAGPLLAKALALGAGAVLARRDAFPAEATLATPEQIRDLAERGELPPEALPTAIALWPSSRHADPDLSRLAKATGRVIAAI